MKIYGDIPRINSVYNKRGITGQVQGASSVQSKRDELSISSGAKDFQTVMKALKDVPDIDQTKVDAVSQKIENGDYQVSGRDIAEKMLKSMMGRRV